MMKPIVLLLGICSSLMVVYAVHIPVCTANWTLLSPQGHSPCEVATNLGALSTCAGDGFHFSDLQPDYVYGPGPNENPVEPCFCTDVMYNVIAACAACQNGDWYTRSNFFENCTAGSVNNYTGFPTDDFSLWMTVPYNPTFSVYLALQMYQQSQPSTTSAASTSSTPGIDVVTVTKPRNEASSIIIHNYAIVSVAGLIMTALVAMA